ncbi:MAG: flagellar hook-associated protein FlgK [Aquificae bacterium]|nr:flagellar hook-associated protein FlgK [Aquificota bacterium]
MSLFYNLSLGGQALLSNKRAIDITNNNISNVFTDSYSRKLPIFTDVSTGGVNLETVKRVYDEILFQKVIDTNQALISDENYKDLLVQVESIFNDIQGSGFSTALNEFFNAFHQVSLNPNDITARYDAITKAKQLVGRIRNSYDNLEKTQDYIKFSLKDQINKLNSLTVELAKINKSIKLSPEEKKLHYLDERDRVLKEISSFIDTKVIFREDGTADVFTSKGFSLVLYDKAHQLNVMPPSSLENQDEITIRWEGVDLTDNFSNGKIGGFIKGYRFVKNVKADLNDFASLLALNVNKIHRQGYDLEGNTDIDFFGIDPDSSKEFIDASNISLAFEEPEKIAAAIDATLTNSDNRNVKKLIELKDSIDGVLSSTEESTLISGGELVIGAIKYKVETPSNLTLLKERNFGELYNISFTTKIGFELETVKKREEHNRFLFEAADQQYKEKSSVNMDEELINLTKLQRAYQASARIISVTDELLQTVLNMAS